VATTRGDGLRLGFTTTIAGHVSVCVCAHDDAHDDVHDGAHDDAHAYDDAFEHTP